MKTSRFSDAQIIAIFDEAEAGLQSQNFVASTASARPPSTRRVQNMWDGCLVARLKELEDEKRRLKKMYAEERLKTVVA